MFGSITARHGSVVPVLVNRDKPTISVYTRYTQNGTLANDPSRTPELLSGDNNMLHPVGESVPSQTIHIPKDLYQYILETEGESTSQRAVDLMQKGREVEHEEES